MPKTKRRIKTKKACKTLLNKSKKIFTNYTTLHDKYITKLKNLKVKFNNIIDKTRLRVHKHMDKLDECLELYPDVKEDVYENFNKMKSEITKLQITDIHEMNYLQKE